MGRGLGVSLLMFLCSIPALTQPNVTAWQILNEGLTDKNPDRRQQAVAAIGSIGLAPAAVKLVEKGLRDDDTTVRQTAAAVLGQIKSTGSIPNLKAALDDPSGEVAFTSARALWDIGDRSGEQVLQDVLTGQQKSSGGVMEGAVKSAKKTLRSPKAMAMMGAKEASGALLGPFSLGITAAEDFLKDSGSAGRALSANMLSQRCDPRNLQLLEWTLQNDKNHAVKAAAAKALGNCGNKDEVPRLEQYLSDSHHALRFMAAASIVRLEGVPDKGL
jgi:HEAT repeat protein